MWKMTRKVVAPVLLAFVFLMFVHLFVDRGAQANILILSLAAFVAVVASYIVWPLSLLSVLASMFIASIVFPLVVLYAIGRGAGIEAPMITIGANIDLPLLMSPLLVSGLAWFIVQRLTTRWRGTRQNPPRTSA